MKLHSSTTAALIGLLLSTSLAPSARAAAFANVKEGEAVPDSTLPTLDGKKEQLLGKGEVSVFVFFRVGQDHSRTALTALGRAQKALKGKPVHWAAVVSDRYAAAEVAADVAGTGYSGPVLVDPVETMYGALGVSMHPCVGITTKDHTLLFDQAFTKINFADVLLARVRFALGDLTRDEMQRVVDPQAAATPAGESPAVRRYYKLGEKLYRAKDYAKALDSAKKCLEQDSENAACHGLLAAVLAKRGSCAEARTSAENAQALDPRDPLAAEARVACP